MPVVEKRENKNTIDTLIDTVTVSASLRCRVMINGRLTHRLVLQLLDILIAPAERVLGFIL